MKKTNLLKGALSVLAVSVLLASCTQVDSRIDTVDTLETPSVKAVAYPGVNYISWNAVKGAQGYKVTKIVDGGFEEDVPRLNNGCWTTDVVPTDKVDVEYKVYALSNTNPTRTVYIYDSKAGSATVTNIFPPVGTEAIELPKYEKDSGWDFDEEADNSEWKDEFIPTAENIDIQYVDGTIVITAPTKAYLKTTVIGYTGNKEEIFYSDYSNKTKILPNYQNKKISNKTTITSAGDYKFKAEVRALAERKEDAFYKASNITLTKTVKVPGIETSKSTSKPEVVYIDDAKTTARVVFTPAVSKDGKTTYAVENYKVYRALKDSKQLDEVTGLKADSRTTTDGKTEVIYVVADTVPTNTVDYDYYVVLNVDGSLEKDEKKNNLDKANISAANKGSIDDLTFTEFDDDKLANDIVAKVSPNSDSKIVSVSYAFSTSDDSSKVLDSAYDHKLVVVPELAETEQAFLIKDVPENNYVFVRAEFAEIKSTGKVNSVVVKVSDGKCTVGKAKEVNINFVAPTQKKGDTDCLLNDWIGNEIDVNGGELVSVKYGKAKNADLAKVAAINGTEVKFAVKDYDEGSNTYDYVFDIPDAGEVGEYIAIAAEVKAEGKKNNLIVQASPSKVSVSGALPLEINVPYPSPILDPKESKYDAVLKVDISKAVYDANNSADNYDSVEISYIKTNKNYEIKNDTEWSEVKKFNFNELSKDEIKEDGKTVGNKYSTTHIITNKTYSATASTEVTEYYVIKVVPKYKVPGAKVDEKTYQRAFTYCK